MVSMTWRRGTEGGESAWFVEPKEPENMSTHEFHDVLIVPKVSQYVPHQVESVHPHHLTLNGFVVGHLEGKREEERSRSNSNSSQREASSTGISKEDMTRRWEEKRGKNEPSLDSATS